MKLARKKIYEFSFLFVGSALFGLALFFGSMYFPFNVRRILESSLNYFSNTQIQEQNMDSVSVRSGIVRSIDYEQKIITLDFRDTYVAGIIKTIQVPFSKNTTVQKGVVFFENGVMYATGRDTQDSIFDIEIGKPIQITISISDETSGAISILHGDILL